VLTARLVVSLGKCAILVIAGCRKARHDRVDVATGTEPLAPFAIGVRAVDQVAGVQDEACPGRFGVGLAQSA
jgi:hypothetical protein